MANFDLNSFLSQVRSSDLARANRFEIQLNSPVGGDRMPSLLCEEASVPGLQALWAPTKIGMWTENRVHGIEFFGESAAFTFYCDSDWTPRTYLENWMYQVVPKGGKEPNYYNTYALDGSVEIKVLDRKDNIRSRWKLNEAFPRLLNITPVAHGGDGIVRVSVTFCYRWWESKGGDGLSALGNIGNQVGDAVGDAVQGAIDDVLGL